MARFLTVCAVGALAIAWVGCNGVMLPPDGDGNGDGNGDGTDGEVTMAEGVFGVLGQPISVATADELETFERGKAVSLRRFDLADGLGPGFNVTFCGACHERPTAGGSAGLYRNFFLAGRTTDDGVFVTSESAGDAGGVLRTYDYAPENPARPAVPSDLLLYEILPAGTLGIEGGSANMWEFKTAPLWGVSQTAPYFHDGAADTLDQAIRMHDGEGATSRGDYQALSESD